MAAEFLGAVAVVLQIIMVPQVVQAVMAAAVLQAVAMRRQAQQEL